MAKEKENKKKNEKRHFMKDFRVELKKVAWPTSKQMVSNVTAVIVIVLVTATIVFILDLGFGLVNEYGINKLKTKIRENQQSQTQVIDGATTDGQTDSNNENVTSEENKQDADNQNAENNNSEQNETESNKTE